MSEQFDYIVVGAGSAGAVVASRLSEDAGVSVLLLEAGGEDKDTSIRIPAAFAKLFKSELDWDYQSEPQPALRGRSIYWPRGKVLGGSSSLNAMMWVPGFAADYDEWARLAGPEWNWDALAPLFASTLVSIEDQRDPRPLTTTFLTAVREAGHVVETANRPEPKGFTQTRVTQKKGARHNTSQAYLAHARARANLTVRTNAHVTRVVFDGRTATGVEYVEGGARRTASALREIVLSGGAVNTPQLLQLSGIGDPEQLRAHGIDVVAASPEVGKNLRDHLVSLLAKRVAGGTLLDATRVGQLVKYLAGRRGMLTSNVAEAYGFVRSDPALALPDLELIYAPVAYVREGLQGIPGHGVSIGPILLRPRSRGEIRLASADPFAKAVVEPNYLSDPEGDDRRVLFRGLELCQEILDAPAFRAVTSDTYIAPEGGERLGLEERLNTALETLSHTLYHPTSTARMGSDEASVVDPELRVRGVDRLRVADASVFPEIGRGHTHAPAVSVGARAARLLKAAGR